MNLNQEQRQLVKRFLDIFLRRKIFIIICVLIAVVAGLGQYLRTPKSYRSSSLIMYQRKINPTKLSPDAGGFRQIVGTVSQQITSRSGLESLIIQFDLYKGARSRLPMEDVVKIMRRHISIKPNRSGNVFEVAFQGSKPRTVLLVTNALAAKFIEENIRLREERVSETTAYIKDELSMAKEALNRKEAAMRDYKLKYYNEMPKQRQTNISRLNTLQSQNQGFQNTMQELERTKILIQEQISLRQELLAKIESSKNLSQKNEPVLSVDEEIAAHQARLDNLLMRYTEKHPDVKRLKSLIAHLEENRKENIHLENKGLPESEAQDIQLARLQKQIEEIDYKMAKINAQREKNLRQIDIYEKWIASAPAREAEWSDLTRDYGQLNRHYDRLVGRSIQADSAESLERRQKGSQFKIIDPAHFPEKPFQPDFMQIMLMALGVGLGAGAALALAIEFLDTSFRDAHDLEKFLGLPVACSIPVIKTNKEKVRHHIKSAIWLTLLVLSVTILGGGIAYLWYTGVVII